MIDYIKLHNFEKHIDNYLEFVPGINVIIGSSNVGKSSIIKAIDWLINHNPPGDSIINYNHKECSVEASFDNVIIKKERDNKENKYILPDKELAAFGQIVPEEIQTLTKICNLNIQTQFDQFFLLQKSPGQIVKELNQFINLELMDKCVSIAKKNVNSKKKEIDLLDRDIEELKKENRQYTWLYNAENDFNIIEQKNIELEKLKDKEKTLTNFDNDLKDLKLNLIQINKRLKIKKQIKSIENKYQEYKEKLDIYQNLLYLQNKLVKYNKLDSVKKDIAKIDKKRKKYEFLNQQFEDIQLYFSYQDKLKKLDDNLAKLKEEKNKMIPEICPLCKNKINKELL